MKKQIKEMPKVVLHLHLDGSLRPETVQEWIKEMVGSDVSLEYVQQLLMVDKDCRDLNQYLEKFDLPVKTLQTAENLKRATFELYEDLAKQNVKYAEIRFAPSLHLKGGLSYEEIVGATIDGFNEAKEKYGIEGSLILCCMRGEPQENHINTVNVAEQFLGKGVCGLDLAGAEALFKTEMYKDTFRVAREKGIPFTIHAGEADGPESIRAALSFFGDNDQIRIGHGIQCIDDSELVEELIRRKAVLEVCPTSNFQTLPDLEKHPLGELYRRGVLVTLSPDNSTVSNVSFTEECEDTLKRELGLSVDDLCVMQLNAVRGSFAPPEVKAKIEAEITRYRQIHNERKQRLHGED